MIPGGPLFRYPLQIPKTPEEIAKDYPLFDEHGNAYRELELRNTHRDFGRFNRQNLWYPIFVKDDQVFINEVLGSEAIYPIWDDGFEGCWTWGKEKASKELKLLVAKQVSGKIKIYRKAYAYADNQIPRKQVKSIWNDKAFFTEKGQSATNLLFGTKAKLFQAPKSVSMIQQCILMAQEKDAIVMDFFSGSSTTAQSVMQMNAEDGGSRRFIMIQIPEITNENSEAFKAGYKTICEIGKERIRRAGKQIKEDAGLQGQLLDTGFRVLKLDSSNMQDVYYAPSNVKQDELLINANNVKPDRTAEDLLFQVMLQLGATLDSKIEKTVIDGKEVFDVADGYLVACFDTEVTETVVTAIAKMKPTYAVLRDSGLANDSVATNFEQIFKTYSPTTTAKVI